jgi:predicted RNase H-like HicB family nuclease
MTENPTFAVELLFDKRTDGRFHVHSPSVPGLHLAGPDLEAIRGDIEPVLKDLLYHNSKMIVDRIEWVPSLEDVVKRMSHPSPPSDSTPHRHY